ncbi:hypothetical protein NPIL_480311 [Nephila pilipes]|uniref:BHLH domain-containing protein n=1 Tax=Nephila pilipes TaxID=299642 RepID=A0A8X6QTD5_NEPPI|nr:hypothetical protein NPIL_156621 [Nephila pilipes]GFT45104.1 hypothetical protein NPIL_94691 [Nephila pilipes]GFT93440.1 hypothetical protein NPIL_479651 [Nephila pilipes]GFU42014.1 hypothetical protein NPIL_480311 [Nephila pilipes]
MLDTDSNMSRDEDYPDIFDDPKHWSYNITDSVIEEYETITQDFLDDVKNNPAPKPMIRDVFLGKPWSPTSRPVLCRTSTPVKGNDSMDFDGSPLWKSLTVEDYKLTYEDLGLSPLKKNELFPNLSPLKKIEHNSDFSFSGLSLKKNDLFPDLSPLKKIEHNSDFSYFGLSPPKKNIMEHEYPTIAQHGLNKQSCVMRDLFQEIYDDYLFHSTLIPTDEFGLLPYDNQEILHEVSMDNGAKVFGQHRDHTYCKDQIIENKPEPQDNEPINHEANVDVWKTDQDDDTKPIRKKVPLSKNPVPRRYMVSIKQACSVIEKTNSGVRKSARNARTKLKGSVETTPSGSDNDDGFVTQTRPAKRARATSRTSSETTQFRSENGPRSSSKSKPPAKRQRIASKSVSRTTNQTVRSTAGRTVSKPTKKKTLKEKQGHKDNEKLRRDKLREAFQDVRLVLPLNYLRSEKDRPSCIISKQKILNGALRRSSESYIYLNERKTYKFKNRIQSKLLKFQLSSKILMKKNALIIRNSKSQHRFKHRAYHQRQGW